MKKISAEISMLGVALAAVLGLTAADARAQSNSAAEPGTTGAGFAQLYDDDEPGKRGPLVVTAVLDRFPAAESGIRAGDIVLQVNGSQVAGRDFNEINRKDMRGAVGATLRLSLVRPADGKHMDVTLTLAAYPERENPASDPFRYTWPGSWADERAPFPLEWSPKLPYRGLEDLGFGPDFDDTASPHYHTYIFLWWLEGTVAITPAELQTDLSEYFRGITAQRGRNYKFTPDLSKVSVNYEADGSASASFGGQAAKSFRGEVTFYDTHGNIIHLHSEAVAAVCPGSNHTAAFFGFSREASDAAIWKRIEAIRDTFQCSR